MASRCAQSGSVINVVGECEICQMNRLAPRHRSRLRVLGRLLRGAAVHDYVCEAVGCRRREFTWIVKTAAISTGRGAPDRARGYARTSRARRRKLGDSRLKLLVLLLIELLKLTLELERLHLHGHMKSTQEYSYIVAGAKTPRLNLGIQKSCRGFRPSTSSLKDKLMSLP